MRILGIDPGIATIGFGVIDSAEGKQSLVQCGVITTPAHTSLSSRLSQIYDDMTELIELFKPDAVSVEELFFNSSSFSSRTPYRSRSCFSIRISRPASPSRTAGA